MNFPLLPHPIRRATLPLILAGCALLLVNSCSSTGGSLPPGIEAGRSYEVKFVGVPFYETPNRSVFDRADYILEAGERVSVIATNDRELEVELNDGILGFIPIDALDPTTAAPGTSTQPPSRRSPKPKPTPDPDPKTADTAKPAEQPQPEDEARRGFFGFLGGSQKEETPENPSPQDTADEPAGPAPADDPQPAPQQPPGEVHPLPDVTPKPPAPPEPEPPAPPEPEPPAPPLPEPPAPAPPLPPTIPAPIPPPTPPPPTIRGGDLDDLKLEPIE